MLNLEISVIIPAHNPHLGRLRRTLAGLVAQTFPPDRWELIVVDNASAPPLDLAALAEHTPRHVRSVREPALGLSNARRRGFSESTATVCLLVDDDNVLAPDYLAHVARLFAAHPQLGAAGGKSLPEFETEPPPWAREFFPLLALRDPGAEPIVATTLTPRAASRAEYPAAAAPIGAGMALRRAAAECWLAASAATPLPDRRGDALTSGGDNDIVLTLLRAGWHVGYFPELSLTHLIPSARLEAAYLARLNRGIQQSWMQVLAKHDANPWPPVAPWTVPLRKARAWFTHRAWSGPAARIRWQGACGHFDGRCLSAP